MTTTGQLDLGAAQIVNRETGELLGYAYTVANGAGQLQRWLLYRDPQNTFEVRPPPESMAGMSLSDWQAAVPGLWRPGTFYVRAQSDVYRHGETYNGETWTAIPGAAQLPEPSYPEGPSDNFQLDPIGGKVISVLQDPCSGVAYTIDGLTDPVSVEYWALPAEYQPAGGSCAASIAMGIEEASSLEEFVGIANRSWAPGCAFVITGCVNYQGDRPPVAL